MQFSQIFGEVASNFPTANEARAKIAVNAAQHEILSVRQWSFRMSTSAAIPLVAGTARYTLLGTTPIVPDFAGLVPGGVVLEMATGGQQKPLAELAPGAFDDVFGHVKISSQPAVYCVQGGTPAGTAAAVVPGGQQQIALSPPPIATAGNGVNLLLRYFRSVGNIEMVSNTDLPILPAQLHYLLILGGNTFLAEAIGSAQKAQQWRALYQARLASAITEDEGMRLRDSKFLDFRTGAYVYPITGQNPSTFDPGSRPDDRG